MSDIQKVFREVVCEALERCAFTVVSVDGQKGLGDHFGAYLHVALSFTGPSQGVVTLTAPEPLCREMAANVPGIKGETIGPDAGDDALKELANVVAGGMPVALFGGEDVHDLSAPLFCRIDRGKWRELAADRNSSLLWVDEWPMLASFTLVAGPEARGD